MPASEKFRSERTHSLGPAEPDPGLGTFNLTSAGNIDVFVRQLDSAGNFVWAGALGGPGFDQSRAIALDAQGNIYTTGSFQATADFDPSAELHSLTSAADNSGNPTLDVFVSKLIRLSAATSTPAASDAALMLLLTDELLNTPKRK